MHTYFGKKEEAIFDLQLGEQKLGKVLSVYRVQNFTLQSLNVAVRCQEYNFGEVKRLDLCMTVSCGHMHFMGRATSISDGIFRFVQL